MKQNDINSNGFQEIGSSGYSNEEIDLIEIWKTIWKGKFIVLGVTFCFSLLSVLYALSLANEYRSEIILAPAQNQGGGIGGVASQYGGLAALAGISIGGNSNSKITQALELLESWPFIELVIEKHNLKPDLFALSEWDKVSKQNIYDAGKYDDKTERWLDENLEPSDWFAYKEFKSGLDVDFDPKTGLVTIGFEHISPNVAFDMVNILSNEINYSYQKKDIEEAKKNIEFLNKKVGETSLSGMKTVFFNMIEGQMQTLMLAEVSEEYLLNTVVPAKVAEQKIRPKRALICILGAIFGGVVSVLVVLFVSILKKNDGSK